jgi:hypothetical protein
MNAPNPLSSDKRAAERKAYEPSMEEILASIRRIIADDQAFAARQAPEPRPAAQARVPLGPPLLNRSLAKERSPAEERIAPPPLVPPALSGFPVDGQFQVFKAAVAPAVGPDTETDRETARFSGADPAWSAEPSAEEQEADAYAADEQFYEESGADLPLVSPQTDAAVSSSFNALIASQKLPSDENLNEILREMLRPMLKAWLDDNLPVLVERLVRAEIERVARGGR